MKKSILALILLLTQIATASEGADYYRVWQGFQKSRISKEYFESRFPELMQATVDVNLGRSLNSYLVAPKKTKPSCVPDEFALMVLHSKPDHQKVRQTQEGKQALQHIHAYDMIADDKTPYVNIPVACKILF